MKLVMIKPEHCVSKAEQQIIFAVVEDNGDRCYISPVNSQLERTPIASVVEVVETACLRFIGETDLLLTENPANVISLYIGRVQIKKLKQLCNQNNMPVDNYPAMAQILLDWVITLPVGIIS